MSNLQLVKSERFGEIEADIYSNGTDIFMTINQLAACMEYASKSGIENILSRNEYLKEPEFSSTHKLWVDGKERETRIFNENGIYEVTMLSGQPKAKEFRAWLREVVKSIRQTGFYGTPAAIDAMLSNPDTMIKMLTAYKAEKEGRAVAEATVKELTPKATYCDHMLDNPGLVPITTISKDYGMTNFFMTLEFSIKGAASGFFTKNIKTVVMSAETQFRLLLKTDLQISLCRLSGHRKVANLFMTF